MNQIDKPVDVFDLISLQGDSFFTSLFSGEIRLTVPFFSGGGDLGVTESNPSPLSSPKLLRAGIRLKTFPGDRVSLGVIDDRISTPETFSKRNLSKWILT